MRVMMQQAIAVLKVWRCPYLPDQDIIATLLRKKKGTLETKLMEKSSQEIRGVKIVNQITVIPPDCQIGAMTKVPQLCQIFSHIKFGDKVKMLERSSAETLNSILMIYSRCYSPTQNSSMISKQKGKHST